MHQARPSRVGRTLTHWLDEQDLFQMDLARQTGISARTVNFLARGRTSVTPQMAIRLEQATGIAAWEWLKLSAWDQLERLRGEQR